MKLLVLLLFVSSSFADVITNFGSGGVSLGSAGGVRYSDSDLLSNVHTPAALVDIEKPSFSAGILYSQDNFTDIKNVVVDSVKHGSASLSTGNVDTDTPDLANVALGIYMPSGGKKKSGLSIFATMPAGKFLSVETTSAYYPQYVAYQSDGQRMNGAINYSSSTDGGLDYSLGVHLFFATGSTVISRFPSSTGVQPSSSNIDLKVDVKPAFAFSFSLRKKWNEDNEISMAFVDERDAKLAFKANNDVNVFVSPIPINVDGSSSLYYDPRQISLTYKRNFIPGSLFLSAEWENWSRFKSSVMIMSISGSGSFEQLNIDQNFKDVVTPRIAWKTRGEKLWWTLGYAYRPSPVTRSVDEANYLDSDKHMIGTSVSSKFQTVFGLINYPHQMSFAFNYHKLNDRYVEKQEADSVGYPGYTISGDVSTVGIFITAEL